MSIYILLIRKKLLAVWCSFLARQLMGVSKLLKWVTWQKPVSLQNFTIASFKRRQVSAKHGLNLFKPRFKPSWQKTNPVSRSQLYCSSIHLEFHWPFYRVILTVRCYACLLINVVIWYCWCRRTSQTDELNIESVTGMLCFCCLMILCLYYEFDHATSYRYAQHTHTGTHAILFNGHFPG